MALMWSVRKPQKSWLDFLKRQGRPAFPSFSGLHTLYFPGFPVDKRAIKTNVIVRVEHDVEGQLRSLVLHLRAPVIEATGALGLRTAPGGRGWKVTVVPNSLLFEESFAEVLEPRASNNM